MDWTQLDWQALDRLRDTFINRAAAGAAPYWRAPADLANYDFTYAERIGWKWDAVLSELRRRGWAPHARALLDWGCGSGVASRRVLRAFGPAHFDTLLLWDHSPLARDYAAQTARRDFPAINARPLDSLAQIPGVPFTLILSHVINELPSAVLAELLALARNAGAIIWVEPGTHADSRALVAVREQLRGTHDVIAPCTHAAACGLLAPGSERHWCHNFAEPPRNIYADSNWVKFGQRAGIDLRSLPYSFLVLQKHATSPVASRCAAARIIGRPRIHKAHAAICACDAGGVDDLTLYKRDDPALFKALDRAPAHPPLYTWKRDPANPARILEGAAFLPSGAAQ